MINKHRKHRVGSPGDGGTANGTRPPRRNSWPLQIYTLGRFELLVEGLPLPTRRKSPQRLIELLQAIVASGGEAVLASYLIDQLWPDSDGDRAVATLSKTLKRLRKYLAVERVVHLDHVTVP